jgi:hypothetical protein
LCITIAILYGLNMNLNYATNISNYVPDSGLNIIVDSILMALSYIVLLNTMIPISLIVSI